MFSDMSKRSRKEHVSRQRASMQIFIGGIDQLSPVQSGNTRSAPRDNSGPDCDYPSGADYARQVPRCSMDRHGHMSCLEGVLGKSTLPTSRLYSGHCQLRFVAHGFLSWQHPAAGDPTINTQGCASDHGDQGVIMRDYAFEAADK